MRAFKLVDVKMDDYMRFFLKDKKNICNNLGCILSSGSWAMHKTQIPLNDKLKEVISVYFNTYD